MESYPSLNREDLEDVVSVLLRVIEQREDDIVEVDRIQEGLSFRKSLRPAMRIVTSDDQLGAGDFNIDADASSAAITIDLDPSPINFPVVVISKSDNSGNAVTIDGNGNEINGSTTLVLSSQYDTAMLQWMGSEWRRIN